MAEVLKQPKKRAVKSDPSDNQIAVGEHRAYCVHCGARNISRPKWRTITCSSCGKKGPVVEQPAKPNTKRPRKTKKAAEQLQKEETSVSQDYRGNSMIMNTLAAIGIIVALSLLLKVFNL